MPTKRDGKMSLERNNAKVTIVPAKLRHSCFVLYYIKKYNTFYNIAFNFLSLFDHINRFYFTR